MEFIKKIVPFLLVAVVFAIGGYFIGVGSLDNQGASLYSGTKATSALQSRVGASAPEPAGMMVACGNPNFSNCTRSCTSYEDSGRPIETFTQTGTPLFEGSRLMACTFLPTSSSGVQLPGGTVRINSATSANKIQ